MKLFLPSTILVLNHVLSCTDARLIGQNAGKFDHYTNSKPTTPSKNNERRLDSDPQLLLSYTYPPLRYDWDSNIPDFDTYTIVMEFDGREPDDLEADEVDAIFFNDENYSASGTFSAFYFQYWSTDSAMPIFDDKLCEFSKEKYGDRGYCEMQSQKYELGMKLVISRDNEDGKIIVSGHHLSRSGSGERYFYYEFDDLEERKYIFKDGVLRFFPSVECECPEYDGYDCLENNVDFDKVEVWDGVVSSLHDE